MCGGMGWDGIGLRWDEIKVIKEGKKEDSPQHGRRI